MGPSSHWQFSKYLGNEAYPNSLFFNPVTSPEIESEIMLTPLNKVYGLYSCPIHILKGAKHIISDTLAEVINMSVCSHTTERTSLKSLNNVPQIFSLLFKGSKPR